ncbi:MAG: hypothetical protein ACLRVE_05940 [Finegoldia magna]|uniref:DUF1659 domain-containing protein n=1 Tax=Finegoldia magna TaxID=1260 RepID=UPI000B91B840|nr:hypothetical protein [Finegoldia magna]MDU5808997.1 hypothetical protein [Finegoldia magna]OXZ29851.1 hypothetical protein B9N57_08605 [Finegoldia magna]
MKKLKITSLNNVDGKNKKSSKTFSNLVSTATDDKLKSAAEAINSLINSNEKHAFVVEEKEI